ncbi:MAG: FeoC-like transcriptional regulator [Nitriliruptoraceae bacterium]
MLLAIREAIDEAEGRSVDLDGLARRLHVDRDAVHAALVHAIDRGWITGVEVAALPEGCGSTGCAPVPSLPACKRCPLAN